MEMIEKDLRDEIIEINNLLAECEYETDEKLLEEIKTMVEIAENLNLNLDEKYEIEIIKQRIESIEAKIECEKEYQEFIKNPELYLGI